MLIAARVYLKKKSVVIILGFGFFLQVAAQSQTNPLPHLISKGTAKQLMVDGKPFLVLGGELGNSSASSVAYMRPAWKKLTTMHLNTVAPAVPYKYLTHF